MQIFRRFVALSTIGQTLIGTTAFTQEHRDDRHADHRNDRP